MTREEAIQDMWINFDITVMHTPATPEQRLRWEEEFVEAMGALGVNRDELAEFLT
ncbi:hypothetical protein ACT17S_00630 [Glutamicibacter mysorens]